MNKNFLKDMKDNLLSQKKEIAAQAARDIDVDTEGDETDEIQGNMLIQLHNQLNIRNSSKLAKIEAALLRINDKTYGLCEDCGESIPEKRLLLNPYFQTCVSCAEEREIQEIQEKQRKRF